MESYVTLREFRYEIKNGSSFTDNPTDFSSNLIGSTQERVQATTRVRVIWTARANAGDIFTINANTLTRQSGSFIDDGFTIGDTIDILEQNVFKATGVVITTITDTVIVFTGAAVPFDFSDEYMVFGKTAKHGFKFNYGLIENQESPSYLSKIDGTLQEFYADGVGAGPIGSRSTAVIPCLTNNQIKSWQNGSCTVRFVQEDYDNPVATDATYYYQEYEIVHEFDNLPYFRDGEVPLLQTNTPPIDLYASGKSLKYIIQSQHFIVLSNPNGATLASESSQLGSVGWFDENFNNFNNNYSIGGVSYTDVSTAAAVSELNAGEQTEVEITIDSVSPVFAANSKFVLNVSYLPEITDYQPDTSGTLPRNPGDYTVAQNFLLDRQLQECGVAATGAGILTDVEGTFISANQIVVKGKVGYNGSQQTQLSDDKYYLVSVIVEDVSLTNETSDRVNLIADVQQYELDADISGLMVTDNSKFKILSHDQIISSTGTTDYKGWVEDTFMVSFPFFLNKSQGAVINTISANLVAYNQTTGNHFVIQPYTFNITGTQIVNGAQQFNVLDERGYQLEANSIFNNADIVVRGDTTIGPDDFREYTMNIGVRANFEDQIPLPTADPNFTNVNDPNNGLNKLSSNYSAVLGYELKLFIDAQVEALGAVTSYRFMTPDLDIKEWERSNVEPAPWACVITTEDQNGNDLSGGISDTENTKVTATFTNTLGPAPVTGMWAYIHLYERTGTIFSQSELSSVQNSAANNRLTPLPAQTFALITSTGPVGSDVTVECEIDYAKIDPTKGYYLEGRLATESEDLIVDIQTTFIGGASGTWNANMTLQDAGNNPLPNGVQVILTIKEGFVTIASAIYLTGETIGVDAPTSPAGLWVGMLPYIPNILVADGMVLQFGKLDWAVATGNVDEVCESNAIDMLWCLQATDGLNTSNLAQDNMGIESRESWINRPQTGCRVENNIAVIAQYDNDVQTLMDTTTSNTDTMETYNQPISSCIDSNTISNGKVSVMHINFISLSANHTIRRSEYDGTCWAQTYSQLLGFEGAFELEEDKLETVNGKSVIWVGTQRGTGGVRGDDRLVLLEWNGASYTETDFSALMETIYTIEPTNNADQNITIFGITIDSNQDIYLSLRLQASTNSQIWRLRKTGSTYNNPADWTAKKMAGLGSGDSDGIGSAALFANARGLDIIGYDGTEGLLSGTDPILMIADGFPNVKFKRGERDSGTDTYDITTEYGGTAGDLDGVGVAARFNYPRDVIGFADQGFMLFADNANDKVYKVTLSTQQVDTFVGFQLNSFQNAISF